MSVPNYRYPIKNINASDDFLKIESYEYKPPGLNLGETGSFAQRSSDDAGYGKPTGRGTVILPMPQTIQDSNGASWGAGTMDPLQTATMGVTMKVIQSNEPVEALGNSIANIFNKGLIKAPIHLSYGNERQLIKIFKKIKFNDWIFCSWRSHYHCLLKGVPSYLLKKEILNGRSISLCFPNQSPATNL